MTQSRATNDRTGATHRPMAMMMFQTPHRSDLATLTAAIARSPIVMTGSAGDHAVPRLPTGFEKIDIAVLRWIATDSRRGNRAN